MVRYKTSIRAEQYYSSVDFMTAQDRMHEEISIVAISLIFLVLQTQIGYCKVTDSYIIYYFSHTFYFLMYLVCIFDSCMFILWTIIV